MSALASSSNLSSFTRGFCRRLPPLRTPTNLLGAAHFLQGRGTDRCQWNFFLKQGTFLGMPLNIVHKGIFSCPIVKDTKPESFKFTSTCISKGQVFSTAHFTTVAAKVAQRKQVEERKTAKEDIGLGIHDIKGIYSHAQVRATFYPKFENEKSDQEKSMHRILAYRDMHERVKSIASRGAEYNGGLSVDSSHRCKHGYHYDLKRPLVGFTTCKQPSNLMLLNTCMVSQRQFVSKSKGGDEADEDVLDDVETRLMREDYEGDDMHMGDSSYGIGSTNFDDYVEWTKDEDNSEVEGGEGEGDSDGEGSDEVSDEDSDDETINDQSDEEFEDEQTDEELDELLANTPLFEPPELIDDLRWDEPLPEFSFRPEGPVFYAGMEYEPEELDVTRPLPLRKREARPKEEISVEEVIDNADFRNVRYLTRFIGETGNILARREFKLRKKSHNRIVKAIKTARFFGLMPYTNMGRPKFVFNEPFDEFSEFYETDEDEKMFDNGPTGSNYQRSFGDTGRRDGGYFGQGQGGSSSQNTRRRL